MTLHRATRRSLGLLADRVCSSQVLWGLQGARPLCEDVAGAGGVRVRAGRLARVDRATRAPDTGDSRVVRTGATRARETGDSRGCPRPPASRPFSVGESSVSGGLRP
ncbi:hypothetical protein GCM10009610_16350 [Pseudonocardia xinjiangensis]